jgi:glycosyltransferase involved in cell wall biosynthesis
MVIVDNAPTSDATRALVRSRSGEARDNRVGVPYRYVREQRAGLSWARNAGIAAAAGEIIAFIDDDERPDRYWLAEIARGFARSPDIGCVSGMILPARLETPFQELFEAAGGHSKGRGFTANIFSKNGSQSPLYPNPPFGAGGNMAFRKSTLNHIGGFDVAMGAGTPARGSEDTLALTLTLLYGHRIAYEPSAFVYHDHYQDLDGLDKQLQGYAVGLVSFYMALLRYRPKVLVDLLLLIPAATKYLKRPKSASADALPWRLPDQLRRRHRRALIMGLFAYPRSVYTQSKLRK